MNSHLTLSRGLLIALLGSVALGGCATIKKQAGKFRSESSAIEQLRLTYRTDTDRLNVEIASSTVVPAAYQSSAAMSLPSCSVGVVHIAYPHPSGRPDIAQVTVEFRAAGTETAVLNRSVWSKILDQEDQESTSEDTNPVLETWTMDIPKWQLQAIVSRLNKARFFRKELTILDPDTFLAVEMNSEIAVGKNYRVVDELDALVVRIRRDGRLTYSPQLPKGSWGKGSVALPGTPAVSSHQLHRLPAVSSNQQMTDHPMFR